MMIDLQPIKQKIADTKQALENQEKVLLDLSQEASRHKNAMENITDLEKVDSICDECEKRLKEISRETKRVKIKIKALKSTLQLAENELAEAIESNRIENLNRCRKEAKEQALKLNKLTEKLAPEIQKLENIFKESQKYEKTGLPMFSLEKDALTANYHLKQYIFDLPFCVYLTSNNRSFPTIEVIKHGGADYRISQLEKTNQEYEV